MPPADTDLIEQARLRFENDTRNHQLTVRHDDGLDRHLVVKAAGDSFYWYEVITWPGMLVINGDCGSFMFARTNDMLEFFEASGETINPGYWAEKLTREMRDSATRYSPQRYRARVGEWCEAVCETLDELEAGGLRAAVCEDLAGEWVDEVAFEASARALLHNFEHGSIRIESSDEWDLREWDPSFLWCCWAIVSAIKRYRSASAA